MRRQSPIEHSPLTDYNMSCRNMRSDSINYTYP